MGGHFLVLVRLALRNLFATKLNIIIGVIILVGTMLVVVGGALLDSMDASMSKSIIGSAAGHIQVYFGEIEGGARPLWTDGWGAGPQRNSRFLQGEERFGNPP